MLAEFIVIFIIVFILFSVIKLIINVYKRNLIKKGICPKCGMHAVKRGYLPILRDWCTTVPWICEECLTSGTTDFSHDDGDNLNIEDSKYFLHHTITKDGCCCRYARWYSKEGRDTDHPPSEQYFVSDADCCVRC